MPMKKVQHIRVIHTTMAMKKLQHIRDISGNRFSRHPLDRMKDTVYERYRIPESLLPILKNFVCKLKPIIIESYTESNESLKITRLRKPDRLLWIIAKANASLYLFIFASGIDKIHNCPKCLKEKHFQKFR
jgi:agmatine/peptidylarginine deiminase